MMTTLIRGGRIVTAVDDYIADVLIEGERIVSIGLNLQPGPDAQIIEAAGMMLFPGGVDCHTHMENTFGPSVTADNFHTADAARTIVFVRKRERLHEVAEWIRQADIKCSYLEGEMVQAKRTEAIKRLTEGRVNVLVATDVAARGIDIDDVTLVINFDMPRTADIYLHRIGRTAEC